MRTFHLKIILALIFSYVGNIYSQCVDSSLINPDAICVTLYAPVCGCNGITYSNSCVAVNIGGVTAWTEGECGTVNPCKNTAQIDSTVMCPAVFEPVCGCDSITYSNSCVAQYYSGITAWTAGPCQTNINYADSCTDLSLIDFGVCDMFLGYGLVNGTCTPISGCGTIVNNVDYSPAILSSLNSCQANCMEIEYASPCEDISTIDFGECSMPLGYGVVNNQCVMISGCGTQIGNIEYSNTLTTSLDSCQLCLEGNVNNLQNNGFLIYPNPVENQLHLYSTYNSYYNIYITDIKGFKLMYLNQITGEFSLNIDELKSGVYFMKIEEFINKKTNIIKFVKK